MRAQVVAEVFLGFGGDSNRFNSSPSSRCAGNPSEGTRQDEGDARPPGNQTAFDTARALARLEGIPGGISTGANVAAALEIASRPDMRGKTIVTFACSFAERYISSALFEGL